MILSTVWDETCSYTASLEPSSTFATFDAMTKEVSVYTADTADAGVYSFTLVLVIDNVDSFVEPINLNFVITID